jgi:hypothetical protein
MALTENLKLSALTPNVNLLGLISTFAAIGMLDSLSREVDDQDML